MEDGVETNNRVIGNVGILTKKSFSLLNSDTTPATFWITNPYNFYENNRAGGSQHYGFWMELPEKPTGLSTKSRICPREFQLGSFKNNFSHSNDKYGLRIFPELNPKNRPCGSFSDNKVIPVLAKIEKFTSWRNKEKGVISEIIGNVSFSEIISMDNGKSGIEVSNLIKFPAGRPSIRDSIVIGSSILNKINPKIKNKITRGIVTPRADNFLVSNITFFNFNSDQMANFGSCSRCEIAGASTDSGARQIDFEKIYFDNSEKNKVIWNFPRQAIFRDLDGTLTGRTSPGWATPFFNHNHVKECIMDNKFDNGLVCDDTVQVRRIAFSKARPLSLLQKNITIWRYNNNDKIDSMLINTNINNENKNNYTSIEFKTLRDPDDGWAVPFVTNYDYAISFDQGINFDNLLISRSVFWNSKDSPINLIFNFTERRDDFETTINSQTKSRIYPSSNTTNLFDKTTYSEKLLANKIKFGDRSINKDKNLFMIHVNGKDFNKPNDFSITQELYIYLKAIKCFNNICNQPPVIVPVPLENKIRLWSDPSSWPNNIIPKENEDVEIKLGWNMILDISPPNIKYLTINGKLQFDLSKDNLELKANRIFINDGELQIGNKTNPFINNAKITLTGIQTDPILYLDNKLSLTNNMLLNLNKIEINGLDLSPYNSKLRKSVRSNGTELLVSPNLKWRPGDEIILSTTTHDYNQTEKLKIKSYDSSSGKLTVETNIPVDELNFVNNQINFDHFGGEAETIIPESNLDNLKSFDERADVILISRGIKIGAEKSSFWGASFYNTAFTFNKDKNIINYPGEMNIKHVEFINCGQNSDFPAAILKGSDKNNEFKHNSFNYIKFAGIHISKMKNLDINDITIYSPHIYGINVEDSENLIISNSFVFNLKLAKSAHKGFIEKGAGFHICIEGSMECKDVVLKNNKNIGSEFMGFLLKGLECDYDMNNIFYNIATASRYGFIIDKSSQEACMKR